MFLHVNYSFTNESPNVMLIYRLLYFFGWLGLFRAPGVATFHLLGGYFFSVKNMVTWHMCHRHLVEIYLGASKTT